MLNTVIIICAILVLLVLWYIFKTYRLVNVLKGSDKQRASQSNKINGILFMVFLVFAVGLFFWYSITRFDLYFMPIASEHGVVTNEMFWITMGFTGVVFILAHVLLFYFSYKYSYEEGRPTVFYHHDSKLEAIWTIIPAIVMAGLVIYGTIGWNNITAAAPEDAEVVEIVGYQYSFKVRYPGKDGELGDKNYKLIDPINEFGVDFTDRSSFDDVVPQEFHLPKGQTVEMKIWARDVIHSVYIPHMRVQMNAVPGTPTRFKFVATKSTQEMRQITGDPEFNYMVSCNKICGKGHFGMKINVIVDEPEDYLKWKSEQKSWLSKNPDYLTNVPADLRELAVVSANIDN